VSRYPEYRARISCAHAIASVTRIPAFAAQAEVP